MDVETLLALVYCAGDLTVRKSEISHAYSGSDLFNHQAFRKVEVPGFYHQSLVYTYLTGERHRMKTYGEGVLQVIV